MTNFDQAGLNNAVRCPACHALNSAIRRTCDLCGANLFAPTAAAEPPAQDRCRNCGAGLRPGADVCGSCGRVQAAPESAFVPPPHLPLPQNTVDHNAGLPNALEVAIRSSPPPGFNIEPLPNGMVILRQTAWSRLSHNSGGTVAAIFVALFMLSYFPRILILGSMAGRRTDPGWFFLLFAAFAVVIFLWAFCYREVLTVGPNFLEKECSFCGYTWKTVIEGISVIRVDTRDFGEWSRSGPQRQRAVRAQNLGRTVTLYSETKSRYRGLFGLMGDSDPGMDTPCLLAGYLGAVTKWQVIDAANGRF